MAKVLIVDDEKNIVNVIREFCEYSGFETDVAYDGAQAVEKCRENHYDCMVIDIMMPKMNGYEAVEEIRKFKNLPIIMCSAKVEEYDRLKGFELGVDDYVSKPFSIKEVIARIKAVVRRSQTTNAQSQINQVLTFNKLSIDEIAHKVKVDGEEIALNNKEYALLLLLAKNSNRYYSREEILDEVWGEGFKSDVRTVDTHIKMLRAHLGVCSDMIKTIRGAGYKFEA